MTRKTTSATVFGKTYTVGDTVHYETKEGMSVENILVRIIKHRDMEVRKWNTIGYEYTFVMADGEKVADYRMECSCGQVE